MAKNTGKKELKETITQIETFFDSEYLLSQIASQDKPSCFNGMVKIKKYKVTKELIQEPIEVLQERLQSLWDHSNNYHDHLPLANMAKSLNYELKGERGSKFSKK
jgi:hypothetical protein